MFCWNHTTHAWRRTAKSCWKIISVSRIQWHLYLYCFEDNAEPFCTLTLIPEQKSLNWPKVMQTHNYRRSHNANKTLMRCRCVQQTLVSWRFSISFSLWLPPRIHLYYSIYVHRSSSRRIVDKACVGYKTVPNPERFPFGQWSDNE